MAAKYVISALLLAATAYATCPSANLPAIAKCYQAFNQYYGAGMMGMVLPSYWVMHQSRTAMLDNQGVAAQPGVCKAGNALVNCVAPYRSCLDTPAFTQIGANSTEAPRWWLDLVVTQYQCGDGYHTLYSDFYCIQAVGEHRGADLDKCNDIMNQQIKNGTNLCVATQTMMECSAKINTNYCDYNAGVYDCGLNKFVTEATNPECKGRLTCPQFH